MNTLHPRGKTRFLSVMLLLVGVEALAALPRVRISPDKAGFVTAEGRSFAPVGVTYFRPDTGWSPQVWRQWDAARAREDFARLKAIGGNTVRVVLSYGSFGWERGKLKEEGVRKFEEFLSLAEESGIYVQPCGRDLWEGQPEWLDASRPGISGDRFADEANLADEEEFWRQFAARFRGRTSILAYELLNEPSVRWTSSAMLPKWRAWCEGRYGSVEKLRAAWGASLREDSFATLTTPKPRAVPGDARLRDYQEFREEIATEWTRRLSAAIKSADAEAMVTVGLVQWSFPIHFHRMQQYAAFRPDKLAPWVDFQSFHFYPLAWGFYEYQSKEAEQNNLSYLAVLLREIHRTGQPVVLGEFGWYGGGDPTFDEGEHLEATEEQQAGWGRAVIELTRGQVAGWMAWTLYDCPGARDATELSGFYRPDGNLKAWGRYFASVAPELAAGPKVTVIPDSLPMLDWNQAVTDPAVGEKFRSVYHSQWLKSR